MRVQLPNGDLADFPDEMPHSEIEAVLQRQFGGEPVSTTEDVLKSGASGLGRGIFKSVDSIGALTDEYVSKPFRKSVFAGVNKALGTDIDDSNPGNVGTMNTNGMLDALIGEKYQPKTDAGRYTNAGAEGLSASLLTPMKGGGMVGALQNASSGAVAGVGAEGGGDLAAATLGEENRAYGNMMGGVVGALLGNYAPGGVVRGASGLTPEAAPVGKELASKARQAYKAVDESAATFAPKSISSFGEQARNELSRNGFVPTEHAKIAKALDDLSLNDGRDLTPAGIDAFMKRLDTIGGDEQGLARILKRKVSGYLDNVTPGDMKSGSADDARLIKEARSTWAQKSRDEALTEAARQIEIRAPGTTKETAIKSAFRSLANDDDFMRGLAPDLRTAVEEAASTGAAEKLFRGMGILNPLRGGAASAAGTLMAGAGYASAVPGLAVPAGMGLISDLIYGGMTSSKAGRAASMVRQGGPVPSIPERGGSFLRKLMNK